MSVGMLKLIVGNDNLYNNFFAKHESNKNYIKKSIIKCFILLFRFHSFNLIQYSLIITMISLFLHPKLSIYLSFINF